MNEYRLLVDWEVIEKINNLPISTRRELRHAMTRIRATADRCREYRDVSKRGFPLDVHLCRGFALKYWIDFADRPVKILALESAD